MDLMSVVVFITSLIAVTLISLRILVKLLLPGRQNQEGCIRVCLVLGSGGHTTEMMALAASLDKETFRPRSYIVAETDQLSRQKVTERESLALEDVRLISVPRAREVGQSYITSIASTLQALVRSVGPIIQLQPQLLLVNGPGM